MPDPQTDSVSERLAHLARLVQATGYHFVTPTPATHARVNARPQARQANTLRDVFGWSRPFQRDMLPDDIFAALAEADALETAPDGRLRSTVRLSSLEGLLFLHSAYPTTSPDSVFFGPDTYRFAQATLPHLRAAVGQQAIGRAIDVGCGAGPGAVLIARAHPAAEVLAADINLRALQFAAANAALADVSLKPVQSDLFTSIAGEFDLIVANPPYMVDPIQRAYRHGGGPLGAGLSLEILSASCERLAPGGRIVLYTGAAIVEGADPFFNAAAAYLGESGLDWSYREVDPDVFGEELERGVYVAADRIAAVVLEVRKS